MKRYGLSAFERSEHSVQQYNDLGSAINQQKFKELATQIEVFQAALEHFSQAHSDEIRNNPSFRTEFVKMCNTIGVDPLATSAGDRSGGSFWASILGKDVNDFYFKLAVRIIEICRETKQENGGLISFEDLQFRLSTGVTSISHSINQETKPDNKLKNKLKKRSKNKPENKSNSGYIKINKSDIEQAIKTLSPLNGSFEIVDFGSNKMLRSIPLELSSDLTSVLQAAEILGHVSYSLIRENFQWSAPRTKTVLDDLVSAGLVWIDSQQPDIEYWLPTWIDRRN